MKPKPRPLPHDLLWIIAAWMIPPAVTSISAVEPAPARWANVVYLIILWLLFEVAYLIGNRFNRIKL